ncbi:ComZ family protein [Bacillus taeanensis]|uniref:Competence protein ComG n=1 Tax=Bacillus taeanensis TaxID=273032 RepID=A0A366Y3V1_9BACI|nr:ComZ family protein [Bacillus taeanensis]RBW71064.1 competence protein ComG [Bacillus taeanensis]
MDQEMNMKFMQIAMKYLPEAKEMLDQKGIEIDMENLQSVLNLLMQVMGDAYELGKQEAKQ